MSKKKKKKKNKGWEGSGNLVNNGVNQNTKQKNMDFHEGLAKFGKEKFDMQIEAPPSNNQNETNCVEIQHVKNIAEGRRARAPYNFVPLNMDVVKAEDRPDSDTYHEGRKTGYIDLNITTETPLYIRDSLDEKDMLEKAEIEKDPNKKYINPDFFSPAGKTKIPGSSLRGMVRTLVEIVSFANFGFFEKERKYHFRSFADKSLDLRNMYADKILCGDMNNGFSQQVKAGYLVKDGADFKIKPAQTDKNGCQFYRVEEDLVVGEDLVIKRKILKEKMNNKITIKDRNGKDIDKYLDNKKYKMGFKKVRFTYDSPKKHCHSVPLYYAKVTDICNTNQIIDNSIEGALVYSGWMRGGGRRPRGKHLHWVIGPATDNSKEFHNGVIEDYKKDVDRHEEANLLCHFKSNPKVEVPCFYIEEEGKVVSFGHTGIFRLAYEQKLKDLLPENMLRLNGIYIAEAIFGNETAFAGRVFFEDAELCNEEGNNNERTSEIPCILAAPKPTTFQHYLVQHKSIQQNRNNFNGIQDYNDNTWLRGNKLYWHKSENGWKEDTISFSEKDFAELLKKYNKTKNNFANKITERRRDKKIDVNLSNLTDEQKNIILDAIGIYEKQHTKIRPIKDGRNFKGRIRFENLSEVELGALLFALDLPQGRCHKLGMGKPLGLGSVKIKPELYISDRKKRYEELFAEWKNEIEPKSENEINNIKKEFVNYILTKIDSTKVCDVAKNAINNLWSIPRMKELEKMLDFNGKPSPDSKTEYMRLEEFKERKVLPLPTEVT